MAKKELIDALNQDLALELGAITQYMWHHAMAEGMESPAIDDFIKSGMLQREWIWTHAKDSYF